MDFQNAKQGAETSAQHYIGLGGALGGSVSNRLADYAPMDTQPSHANRIAGLEQAHRDLSKQFAALAEQLAQAMQALQVLAQRVG